LNLETFSEECFVEHKVRYYKKSSIAWLNLRWLVSEGVDISDPTAVCMFEKRVTERYAFGKPTEDQNEEDFLPLQETVIADRYGATGGSYFGGSGRCSIKDNYIIKGTGRTALASPYADADHSNGLVEMGEAIREVIYSELFYHELPNQSVPILAVIDTGTKAYFNEDGAEKRVALVIRPFFVRPAHFERSIFYDHNPKQNQSTQPIDAKRVQFYAKHFSKENPKFFEQMWQGIVEQKAAERALRLWSGRFLTSNMEFTGKSVDFGMSSSLPGWFKYYHHSKECFGEDSEALVYGMRSTFEQMIKYQREHNSAQRPNMACYSKSNDILNQANKKVEDDLIKAFKNFIRQMLPANIFDNEESINIFVDNLTNEYLAQQKISVPFLSKMCVGTLENPVVNNDEHLSRLVRKIYKSIRLQENPNYANKDKISEKHLGFVFSNRPATYYSMLRQECSEICDILCENNDNNKMTITSLIENTVSSSRRYWPQLHGCIVPTNVKCDSVSSVVWGETSSTVGKVAFVEAIRVSDSAYILGKKLPLNDISQYCIEVDDKKWAGLFSSKELDCLLG
jgi:hypothetical protein